MINQGELLLKIGEDCRLEGTGPATYAGESEGKAKFAYICPGTENSTFGEQVIAVREIERDKLRKDKGLIKVDEKGKSIRYLSGIEPEWSECKKLIEGAKN